MKLSDPALEAFLKRNGFCKYDLNAKHILRKLYEVYGKYYLSENTERFFVTHNQGNAEASLKIHEEICEICEPVIAGHWEDFEIFAAHFVVKKAKSETGFQLHQDFNNVDESIESGVQIWIPLSASYPENGGMGFFPESHRFFNNYRSGSFDTPRVEVEPKLYPYLSYLRLFPGEAAFFYNSTFHCSFINSTDEDRVAVLINIIPKGHQKIYSHQRGDFLEQYAISTSGLYENLHLLEKGLVPENMQLLDSRPYTQIKNSIINADMLIAKLSEIRAVSKLPADYEVKQYSIIKDKELEKEINHRGYKVIDFLTDKERQEILALFPEYFPDRSGYKGRYSSMDNLPASVTLQVHQEIQNIIKDRIAYFFEEAYSPVSILYSKKPDGVMDIDWHSDPSFMLNEHLEPLYGIWCSLYDIGHEEGALMVVPGSHRFIKRLNGTPVTWTSPLADKLRYLDKYGVQPNLKAGQALLYDTRIIHSSSPNRSNIDRDCVVMRIVSKQSEDFFHILMDENDAMKGYLYRDKEDFFYGNIVKSHSGQGDKSQAEGIVQFFPYPVTPEDIDRYFDNFR